jgi:hypothetical protein
MHYRGETIRRVNGQTDSKGISPYGTAHEQPEEPFTRSRRLALVSALLSTEPAQCLPGKSVKSLDRQAQVFNLRVFRLVVA